MWQIFVIISIITMIKHLLMYVNDKNKDRNILQLIIYDLIHDICYSNVYSLLTKIYVPKDIFIIIFAPMIIIDILNDLAYLINRNIIIYDLVKILTMSLIKLLIIGIFLLFIVL